MLMTVTVVWKVTVTEILFLIFYYLRQFEECRQKLTNARCLGMNMTKMQCSNTWQKCPLKSEEQQTVILLRESTTKVHPTSLYTIVKVDFSATLTCWGSTQSSWSACWGWVWPSHSRSSQPGWSPSMSISVAAPCAGGATRPCPAPSTLSCCGSHLAPRTLASEEVINWVLKRQSQNQNHQPLWKVRSIIKCYANGLIKSQVL